MLKAAIFLGLSVIENREIVLLQIRDGLALAVDHHVHFNQPGVDAKNGVSWATARLAARQSRPIHLIDPTIRNNQHGSAGEPGRRLRP